MSLIKHPRTMKEAVQYLAIVKNLAPRTVAWYGRVVNVYCHWAKKDDVPVALFDGTEISRMLLDKERDGRSLHYLKSLRGGLIAFLRLVRNGEPIEPVRRIKPPPLDPHALTPAQVEKLLAACQSLSGEQSWLYTLIFSLGYYSGLDMADILRIERSHIRPDGTMFFRRGKTGSPVFVRFPDSVVHLIEVRGESRGPLVRLPYSRERFRQIVRQIFDAAGLSGSFKTLRKSAGSLVEAAKPGTGHRHLGNTRVVFEKHYEAHAITRTEPTMPPEVKLPAVRARKSAESPAAESAKSTPILPEDPSDWL